MTDGRVTRLVLGSIAFLGVLPVTAGAAFLTNGDFETEPLGDDSATTTFPNWTEAAGGNAVNTPVPITGAHSAKLVAGGGSMSQSTSDPGNGLTTFTFDLDFAASDPGGPTNRSFHLNVRHAPTAGGLFHQINVRVVDIDSDGDGDVQVFNSPTGTNTGSWITALPSAVVFSASDTDLGVNHLTIVGDYSDATPSYDLTVNAALSAGRTEFHGTPILGEAVEQVSFETGSSAGGSFYVVDNITLVPEPAAVVGLVSLATLPLLRRPRRDR